LLKRIRWGGRRLGTVLGKRLGPESDYAESWEICDHGADQSIVASGPLQGTTLKQLVHERGRELLGRQSGWKQFPLLIKYLDAHDRLSVQVHPDDSLAKQYDPQENGKTEAWVILSAEPGSRIYAGLRPGVDAAALRDALARGTVEDCLHSLEVQAGDCYFIPAGTVHALAEGIVLAEVQQSSDLTFRLYDWGRLGTDGQPRPLHIEQSITCTNFQQGPVSPAVPTAIKNSDHPVEELVRSPYFVLRRHTGSEPFVLPNEDRCTILLQLAGAVQLESAAGIDRMPLGESRLIPAAAHPLRCVPEKNSVLLEAFVP
jgi:mannose-6-phosphate isomerase